LAALEGEAVMTNKLPIRLAMRAEGDWWVAYMAQPDTMDGAKRLGSILLGIVERNAEHKQTFMALMQEVMTAAIKDVFGQTPDWSEPQAAPESERSGRA
jgi:hypothetical protein